MMRIAVIGGGVSGLAAAYTLEKNRRKGVQVDYVLFEASARFGGVIRTERAGDFVIEAGPDSFLTEKTWARNLCCELGLEDQLIPSNDAGRRTYIFLNGRLVPLSDGLTFMIPTKLRAALFSPLFSWPTRLRMIGEWFYRPAHETRESSVAEFVERHYGREMVERVADPLLAGVYGGSADELSVTSVLPRFAEIEAKHGSLTRAMVRSRKLHRAPQPALFTSLRDGMQSMTDAVTKQIPEAARRAEAPVDALKPESGKWMVITRSRTEEFDGVIPALGAHGAARLFRSDLPQLSSELDHITYSSSIVAALAYDQSVRASLPKGFGLLVPRQEGKRILACTFVHQKFPHRAPENSALLRCFVGGSRDEAAMQLSEEEMENITRRELREILGVTAEPMLVKTFRWPRAMAQYGIGHKARIERIGRLVSSIRGLALAGNAFGGIGIPDCIRSGFEAVAKVMADLGM
ncbi:MAG: protoporphyrinogen oxidase [Acidobacteria bacterium]|nr:protoporphyrinogen oxidase [Acidobacteriota bacterium]